MNMNFKRRHQQPCPMAAVGNHAIRFDVMEVTDDGDERFVCTMTKPHNALFAVPYEEFEEFVIAQRPSMAKKHFRIVLW